MAGEMNSPSMQSGWGRAEDEAPDAGSAEHAATEEELGGPRGRAYAEVPDESLIDDEAHDAEVTGLETAGVEHVDPESLPDAETGGAATGMYGVGRDEGIETDGMGSPGILGPDTPLTGEAAGGA